MRPYSALCLIPDFLSFAMCPEEWRQMREKPQSHKYDLTSSPLISPHSFVCCGENARHACTTSAVNDSVPPKVNFQFAQWRGTITFWPANCISSLIPYHFILGCLCSLDWFWLNLVAAICLLFSAVLWIMQPVCIRGVNGAGRGRESSATWPW